MDVLDGVCAALKLPDDDARDLHAVVASTKADYIARRRRARAARPGHPPPRRPAARCTRGSSRGAYPIALPLAFADRLFVDRLAAHAQRPHRPRAHARRAQVRAARRARAARRSSRRSLAPRLCSPSCSATRAAGPSSSRPSLLETRCSARRPSSSSCCAAPRPRATTCATAGCAPSSCSACTRSARRHHLDPARSVLSRPPRLRPTRSARDLMPRPLDRDRRPVRRTSAPSTRSRVRRRTHGPRHLLCRPRSATAPRSRPKCWSELAAAGLPPQARAAGQVAREAASGADARRRRVAGGHRLVRRGEMRVYGDARTLYGRVGGVFGLAKLADRLMDSWMKNATLNANAKVAPWTASGQRQGFKFLVTQVMCGYLTGGPQKLHRPADGRRAQAPRHHARRVDAFMADAALTMDALRIAPGTQAELGAIFASFRRTCIIEPDGRRCLPTRALPPAARRRFGVRAGGRRLPDRAFVDALVDLASRRRPRSAIVYDDVRSRAPSAPPAPASSTSSPSCSPNGRGRPRDGDRRKSFDPAKLGVLPSSGKVRRRSSRRRRRRRGPNSEARAKSVEALVRRAQARDLPRHARRRRRRRRRRAQGAARRGLLRRADDGRAARERRRQATRRSQSAVRLGAAGRGPRPAVRWPARAAEAAPAGSGANAVRAAAAAPPYATGGDGAAPMSRCRRTRRTR